jgi:ABC-type bacteriocin/lantibiotic exporter with double-glycine peptidase domain
MVLSHLDVSKSEAELRELCDCMILGTAAVELVLAARKLGFAASSKQARLKKAAKSATGRAIRANDPDRANDPLRSY